MTSKVYQEWSVKMMAYLRGQGPNPGPCEWPVPPRRPASCRLLDTVRRRRLVPAWLLDFAFRFVVRNGFEKSWPVAVQLVMINERVTWRPRFKRWIKENRRAIMRKKGL